LEIAPLCLSFFFLAPTELVEKNPERKEREEKKK
jgi:hypothetical protein